MVVVSGSAVHEPFRSSKTGEFMHGVRKPPYNCAVARSDIGVPTCELVDANVAVFDMSVSSSQLAFTSVIVPSVASNLRRRSVFVHRASRRFSSHERNTPILVKRHE